MTENFIRDTKLEGLGPWLWPGGDSGLWDGPSENWPTHKAVWEKAIKNRRVCIQAGGGAGMYPVLLNQMFDLVITFEPDVINYACLKDNVERLGKNIVATNHALGDEITNNCWLDIGDPGNRGASSIKNMSSDRSQQVSMTTLDTLYPTIERVDFIQLDVEGHEYFILNGGKELIRRNLPAISCENASPRICTFLEQFGYKIFGRSHADTTFTVGLCI